jgi:predicted kinase
MPIVRLAIPDPSLVLLVGPSGAGKSTFAAAHFRPTEVLSSDNLRARLSDDPNDQAASADAFRLLALLLDGRLKRRLLAVVDATNLRAANRRRLATLAGRYGVPVVAVAFALTAEDYSRNNLLRPSRQVEPDVVARQAALMQTALAELPGERYAALYVLRGLDDVAGATVERRR